MIRASATISLRAQGAAEPGIRWLVDGREVQGSRWRLVPGAHTIRAEAAGRLENLAERTALFFAVLVGLGPIVHTGQPRHVLDIRHETRADDVILVLEEQGYIAVVRTHLVSRYGPIHDHVGRPGIDGECLLQLGDRLRAIVLLQQERAGQRVRLPARRVVFDRIGAERVDDEAEDLRDAVEPGVLGRPAGDEQQRLAHALVLAVLQHAQQLRLQLERQLADLVEEQRPVERVLEVARLRRRRASLPGEPAWRAAVHRSPRSITHVEFTDQPRRLRPVVPVRDRQVEVDVAVFRRRDAQARQLIGGERDRTIDHGDRIAVGIGLKGRRKGLVNTVIVVQRNDNLFQVI